MQPSNEKDLEALLRRMTKDEIILFLTDEIDQATGRWASERKRLFSILEAWLATAREHLDSEVAGRTFAALKEARDG